MAEAKSCHWVTPGVRCVCIGEPEEGWAIVSHGNEVLPNRLPMEGEVLTIRGARRGGNQDGEEHFIPGDPECVYLGFWEIPLYQSSGALRCGPIMWAAEFFQPLAEQETSISIFKAMLNPSKTEVTA